MRGWGVLAGALALAAAPTLPAAADPARMTLDCGGDVGVIERSNGSSWWGVDDSAVYTTKYLKIVSDDGGVYEKRYGHAADEPLVCQAAHVTPDHSSSWTVHLVPSR